MMCCRSFKLNPLERHLEPKKLQCAQEASDNVFIFTPLNLGATDSRAIVTDVGELLEDYNQ